jgi:hypothetical protein
MKFFVSRQQYWGVEPEEGTIVEVCTGGSDYANADMLCPKWRSLGEGRGFKDPREAIEAAITIKDAWIQAGEENAKVGYGSTGGFTLPFEGKEDEDCRAWAEKVYAKLPKCQACGELRGEERECFGNDYSTHMNDKGERYPFCSQYCAEKDQELNDRLTDAFEDVEED